MANSKSLSAYSLKFRLKLAYAKVLGIQRSSYKEVWNKISRSRDLAMIGVAGNADDNDFLISGQSTANSLTEILEIDSSHKVLEIGCGVGRIGKFLSSRCKEWIGCDISSEMIKHAKRNLSDCPNVSLFELKNSTLEMFGNETLDRVYCTAVFMHLDEWDRFKYVEEAYRVLKPGGSCYFDNINLAGDTGWSIFLDMASHDPALRPPNISKASTPEELKIYLNRAGFTDIKLYPGSHWLGAKGVK